MPVKLDTYNILLFSTKVYWYYADKGYVGSETRTLTRREKMNYEFKKTNIDQGVESRVSVHSKGYAVTLWDLDANMAVSLVKIYPSLEAAIASAKSMVVS